MKGPRTLPAPSQFNLIQFAGAVADRAGVQVVSNHEELKLAKQFYVFGAFRVDEFAPAGAA